MPIKLWCQNLLKWSPKLFLLSPIMLTRLPKLMDWYSFEIKIDSFKKMYRCFNERVFILMYQYKYDKYKIVA